MTKNHPAPAQIHVLLSHGAPIAAQLVPFVLPEYSDKVSLSQVVYVPQPPPVIKKCCVCGTTENLRYEGLNTYRCDSPDCMVY